LVAYMTDPDGIRVELIGVDQPVEPSSAAVAVGDGRL
jgi:hypothetical protein